MSCLYIIAARYSLRLSRPERRVVFREEEEEQPEDEDEKEGCNRRGCLIWNETFNAESEAAGASD